MSARDQILEFLGAHPGEQSTADISAAVEAPQSSVYATLSALASTGEITRVATGRYTLTGAATKAKTKKSAAETPPPDAECQEPATAPGVWTATTTEEPADVPLEVPELLQMGIWSTGELTLARGEQSIQLAPNEVREMVQFLDKVGAVPTGAA